MVVVVCLLVVGVLIVVPAIMEDSRSEVGLVGLLIPVENKS